MYVCGLKFLFPFVLFGYLLACTLFSSAKRRWPCRANSSTSSSSSISDKLPEKNRGVDDPEDGAGACRGWGGWRMFAAMVDGKLVGGGGSMQEVPGIARIEGSDGELLRFGAITALD